MGLRSFTQFCVRSRRNLSSSTARACVMSSTGRFLTNQCCRPRLIGPVSFPKLSSPLARKPLLSRRSHCRAIKIGLLATPFATGPMFIWMSLPSKLPLFAVANAESPRARLLAPQSIHAVSRSASWIHPCPVLVRRSKDVPTIDTLEVAADHLHGKVSRDTPLCSGANQDGVVRLVFGACLIGGVACHRRRFPSHRGKGY